MCYWLYSAEEQRSFIVLECFLLHPYPPPNDSYARILTHLITLFGVFRKLRANFGELKKKDNFFLLSVAAVSSYIP